GAIHAAHALPQLYPLSLHDALPISDAGAHRGGPGAPQSGRPAVHRRYPAADLQLAAGATARPAAPWNHPAPDRPAAVGFPVVLFVEPVPSAAGPHSDPDHAAA